ncbi:protein brambleberry-like [Petromyzon marinus]|uniref:protein brambleberry-like n=1 Tax=Petromyzon marinus TaxID=7757 RepID=UPI003F6F488A
MRLGVLLRIVLYAWLLSECSGLFGWFRRKDKPAVAPTPEAQTSTQEDGHGAAQDGPQGGPERRGVGAAPPFELVFADERFLAEARHLELSPLDTCHYQVIGRLKGSCDELSEEDLAKLGVSLLNCQSLVEDRRTFQCTADMSLSQCTAEMDPTTWNAYHIVSNRVRSVCYATRQLQFRRRTEHVVNSLVETAHDQLDTMRRIKESNEKLSELTEASIQNVLDGQGKLLSHQEQLDQSQSHLQLSISSSMEQVLEQKSLIATGHQLLAEMTMKIQRNIDDMSSELEQQGVSVKKGHHTILKDLSDVGNRAAESHQKLEAHMALINMYQDDTSKYYSSLMSNLQRLNHTVGYLLQLVDSMQSNMNQKLDWLAQLLGGAGDNISVVYTFVLHAAYLLLAAVVVMFLQAPALTRAMLILCVVVNAVSEIKTGASFDFIELSVLTVTFAVGYFLVVRAWTFYSKLKPHVSGSSAPSVAELAHFTSRKSGAQDSSSNDSVSGVGDASENRNSTMLDEPADNSTQEPIRNINGRRNSLSRIYLTAEQEPFEFLHSVSRSSGRHLMRRSDPLACSSLNNTSSLLSRGPCGAITRSGLPCRKKALVGRDFCHLHFTGTSFCLPSLYE